MKFRLSSDASVNVTASEKLEDIQTRRIITACGPDMAALWAAPTVQSCLNDQGILLQDQAGLFASLSSFTTALHQPSDDYLYNSFLSDVLRVTDTDYKPTAGKQYVFYQRRLII